MAGGDKLRDGYITFIGGSNQIDTLSQGLSPYYFKGFDVRLEGHHLKNRYGLHQQEIIATNPDDQWLYDHGRTQSYIARPNKNVVYELISGYVFKTNLKTGCTTKLEYEDGKDHINRKIPRVNRTWNADFLTFFDLNNTPLVLEGNTLRRTDVGREDIFVVPAIDDNGEDTYESFPNPEMPSACIGAYNADRPFIARGNTFTAGDPQYVDIPDAGITFREVLADNREYTDEWYTVGSSSDFEDICAMGFFNSSSINTGFGNMFIGTANNIYLANTQDDRASWTTGGSGNFIRLALPNIGMSGNRNWKMVNDNLWWWDLQGNLRNFSTEVANRNRDRRKQISLTNKIQELVDTPHPELYKYGVMEFWDNKLFTFIQPKCTISYNKVGCEVIDYAFKGILVIDFENVANENDEVPATFLGAWRGADFQDMQVVNNELYIKGKVGDKNYTFKVQKDSNYDYFEGKVINIESRVYFKRIGFGNRLSKKEIDNIEIDVNKVEGCYKVDIYYKPHSFCHWSYYKSWKYKNILTTNLLANPRFEPHSFESFSFGKPECIPKNASDEKETAVSKEHDLRIDFKGAWELSNIKLTAIEAGEDCTNSVGNVAECSTRSHVDCSFKNDFDCYKIQRGDTICRA